MFITRFCWSRIPLLAFLWTLAVVCALAPAPVEAQTFELSLDDLRELYERLEPTAAWDTTVTEDISTVPLGPRYRVPNFLDTDFGVRRTDVEYGALSDFRVTLSYQPIYSLEFNEGSSDGFMVFEPRDLTVPGLEIELVPIEEITERVMVESRRQVWKEEVQRTIRTQEIPRGRREGALNIDIPLPMPKQLESIFGPGDKTHINLSGRESITFAGETRVIDPFVGFEGQQSQSLFPSLDMKQELDVTLTGSIGDKVNVRVDHSSEAIGDDANRIELNYQGYEDDVVQRIDLGNTSLSLPGSQLINFSSSSRGLFGVKMLAQIGNTDLTVIASKQEGETSSASFSPRGGGIGQTDTREIRDTDYIKRRYFFLDHPLGPRDFFSRGSIVLYESVKNSDFIIDPTLAAFPGIAFVDSSATGADINAAMATLVGGGTPPQPTVKDQRYRELKLNIDYDVIEDLDTKNALGIVLRTPIDEDRVLAVSYENQSGNQIGGFASEYGVVDSLATPVMTLTPGTRVLEVIKPRNAVPTDIYGYTWDFHMKFYYNLGLNNIDGATLEVEILDRTPRQDQSFPEGTNVQYLRIFGLDQTDQTGSGPRDNRIDLTEGLVDLRNGILQFPSLTPFSPDTTRVKTEFIGDPNFEFTPKLREQFETSQGIYDDLITPETRYEYEQYVIRVSAVSTTKSFQLDAFNILENSEVITLDGQRLTRGTDYTIDYETGEVELRGSALDDLRPDSRINIDYEFKPFGGGASSSLVGFNATSKLGDNGVLGTTWLYESKSVSTGNPRLGEEPTRAVVGGVNGNYTHDSRFLTDLVNKLPLVDTDAKSAVNVSGEFALSIPDPNTQGEAYIDDFEGAEDSDQIGVQRTRWYPASRPVELDTTGAIVVRDAEDRRGFIWYNIENNLQPSRRDFNPRLDERENTLVRALDIEINPGQTETEGWVGIMTGFGGGGLDLSQGQFLEIWVNDFTGDSLAARAGQLVVDIGVMDEDFHNPGAGVLDDEDKDRDGFAVALDDTGFDRLFSEDEPGYDENTNPDPNGDDFSARRIDGRFTQVNGFENNQIYDTEDLDRSGQLDDDNVFRSYRISLADTGAVDLRTDPEFVNYDGWNEPGHEDDAWRLYRIPLSDGVDVSDTGAPPRFEQVRHIRIWFDDYKEPFKINRRFQISQLKVVGNRWKKDGVRRLDDSLTTDADMNDTDFAIGVISTKTDPGRYVPPVIPNVENEVAEKETSLFLRYERMAPETQVRILKNFLGSGQDWTRYRDLNFWVHIDRPQMLSDDLEYYFRIGVNETNYYEVTVPFKEEFFQPNGWSRVIFKLEDITSLKFVGADSLAAGVATDVADPDKKYPVYMLGNPNLFTVRFLYAGVRNLSTSQVYSGEVWMNDIFLGDVKRDIDYAQRVSASVSLGGGIINLTGGWTRTGPDFRGLRQRAGSGTLGQAYNFGAKTRLEHFVPLFGFSIPVSGNYNKNTQLPKFTPNSDTEITDPSIQDSLRTEQVRRGFSTQLSRRGSKNPILKYTLDKISTSFSYSETKRIAPASRDTTKAMTGTFSYDMNWRDHSIDLFRGIKWRWWLNSLTFRVAADRRTTQRWRLVDDEFRPDPYLFDAGLRNSGTANYSPFRSLSSSFSMNINRDVKLPGKWLGVDVGREVGRNHNLKVTYKPPPMFLIKAFSPDLIYNSTYQENSGPNVRRQGDPVGTRNVNANRNVSGKMRFDFGKYAGILFERIGLLPKEKQPERRGVRPAATRPADRRPPGAGGPAGADTTGARVPPQPQPPGGATAEGDTTGAGPAVEGAVAGADTTESGGRPDPMTALRKFGQIVSDVRRVNMSVTQRVSNNYTRIPDRPGIGYQIGLTNDASLTDEEGAPIEPDRVNKSLTIAGDSGVEITENIDVSARYSRTATNQTVQDTETESISVSWPDVNVSWKGLERFGVFRTLIASSQATMNYRKTSTESGRKGDIDTRTESVNLAPAIVFVWKNEINSNLTFAYTKNTSDQRGAKSETNNYAISLDLKKDFRGGAGFKLPLPFFRKEVKWTSTLQSNLKVAYSQSGGKAFDVGTAEPREIPKTTSIQVSPNLNYNFTRALTGRLFVDYTRSYSASTGQTTTTVRVGINAVFVF